MYVLPCLDSVLKSTDITLPTKVHLVKTMVFQVVMYGCESWTVKKAERQRIDAFELWCWRRLLRVPWTARRSSQSILKEISPGCSLEGMMLKLKLQYFGHLMWRVDSLEKTDAGRDWGQEEKGTTEDEMAGWHHRLDGREFEWTLGVGDGQGGLAYYNSWGPKESDTTEQLNWTDSIWKHLPDISFRSSYFCPSGRCLEAWTFVKRNGTHYFDHLDSLLYLITSFHCIKDDPLQQIAMWIQRGVDTKCSGHGNSSEGHPERNLAQSSRFTLLWSTGIDNDLGKQNPDLALSSKVTQMVKNLPAVQETWVHFLLWRSPGEGNG